MAVLALRRHRRLVAATGHRATSLWLAGFAAVDWASRNREAVMDDEQPRRAAQAVGGRGSPRRSYPASWTSARSIRAGSLR